MKLPYDRKLVLGPSTTLKNISKKRQQIRKQERKEKK
jgi:hypothetical protein